MAVRRDIPIIPPCRYPDKLSRENNELFDLFSFCLIAAYFYRSVGRCLFWNTGTPSLAREALAVNFIDKTPPEGRKQGPEGAILASRAFRTAVPDLRCDVEQMIISGNRVVSHLHFHGTFTGTFGELKGKGQKIDFIATDIYEING